MFWYWSNSFVQVIPFGACLCRLHDIESDDIIIVNKLIISKCFFYSRDTLLQTVICKINAFALVQSKHEKTSCTSICIQVLYQATEMNAAHKQCTLHSNPNVIFLIILWRCLHVTHRRLSIQVYTSISSKICYLSI